MKIHTNLCIFQQYIAASGPNSRRPANCAGPAVSDGGRLRETRHLGNELSPGPGTNPVKMSAGPAVHWVRT